MPCIRYNYMKPTEPDKKAHWENTPETLSQQL